MSGDLYDALGLDRGAPADAVKGAYRKAAKRAHPDAPGGSAEAFALVATAKDVLSDEKRRAHYDRTGEIGEGGPDKTESQSIQIAQQAIMDVMRIISQRRGRPETYDLIADAIQYIDNLVNNMLAQKRGYQEEADTMRKLARRFTAKKGKTNILGQSFENNALQLERQAEGAVEFVPAHEAAIRILQDHNFKHDPASDYF